MDLDKEKEIEDVHSFIINIPKPRVFAEKSHELIKVDDAKRSFKRTLDRRLRKPSDFSIEKYSLPGGKPLPTRVLKRDELLLPYMQYAKKEKKGRHKQALDISVFHKYKIISTDLRKRLHVEFPPDDVVGLKDIDEGFFKYVNGRPLPHRMPLFKSLKYLSDNQLRLRQEVGYRKDCLYNIDVNFRKEQETYNLAVQTFTDQAKYFDSFISSDYQKSIGFLNQWDELKDKVNDKNIELENAANEIFTIVSRLIGLDYRYSLLQKYGRFLYYLSPPMWRLQNREFARSIEIEAKGFDFGTSNENDTFDFMFEKMRQECFNEVVKPVLFFTQPSDLMDVFETMEQQQLHHFLHVTHMAPYAKTLSRGIKTLKELIAQDSALLANLIEGFESLIQFYEERSNELEAKFYKVLNGTFYESVGTLEVLKFHLHLEFCYEKVFAETPINSDLYNMGRALENFYMGYRKRLDSLHSGTVQQALNQILETEKWKHKATERAAQELRAFERLKHELLIAFAPVPERSEMKLRTIRKPRYYKSKKGERLSRCSKEDNRRKTLSEEEIEYLKLFTHWTETEDPGLYLQSFSKQ